MSVGGRGFPRSAYRSSGDLLRLEQSLTRRGGEKDEAVASWRHAMLACFMPSPVPASLEWHNLPDLKSLQWCGMLVMRRSMLF